MIFKIVLVWLTGLALNFVFSNTAPQAVIALNRQAVKNKDLKIQVGSTLLFSADNSRDADRDSLSYCWNMGDGTISYEKNIQHRFPKVGKYVVRLKVDDGKYNDEAPYTNQGRWLVAVHSAAGEVTLSWRFLKKDSLQTGFNVYRGEREAGPFQKINVQPVTIATYFVDKKILSSLMPLDCLQEYSGWLMQRI